MCKPQKPSEQSPRELNEAALKVHRGFGRRISQRVDAFARYMGTVNVRACKSITAPKSQSWFTALVGAEITMQRVVAYLREKGVLPTTANLSSSKIADEDNQKRSSKKRRNYAVRLWNALKNSGGRNFGPMLEVYLNTRRIKKAPPTAMMTLPIGFTDSTVGSHEPGMVLPIRNAEGKLQGDPYESRLNADLTDKCSEGAAAPNLMAWSKAYFVALDVKID